MSLNVANPSVASIDANTRQRVVVCLFAAIAAAIGIFAVVGSAAWIVPSSVILLCGVAALTLPLPSVALVLAALTPLQIFFEIPGSTFTLRGAVLFLLVTVVRLLVRRLTNRNLLRWNPWVFCAGLFLVTALVAAMGAANRYVAFKGIYDWSIVFATIFVIGEIVQSERLGWRLTRVLIAGGVIEAGLGLAEYWLGGNRVIEILQTPIARALMQPNLLRERLIDFSFNWFFFDRVTPFGTFINAIDYALYLAAILVCVVSLLLARQPRRRALVLLLCAAVIGVALVLSFKGSGVLAVTGGGIVIASLHAQRNLSRTLALGFIIFVLAILVALPFSDLILQRVSFIVQREQGSVGSVGRLDIWMNLIPFLAERPLVGFGLNNSIFLTEPTRTLRAGVAGLNLTASENAYLALLIETGAIGFAAWLALVVAALGRGYQRVRVCAESALVIGWMGAIGALLVGNISVVSFVTEQNGMLLGILMGMVFAAWELN